MAETEETTKPAGESKTETSAAPTAEAALPAAPNEESPPVLAAAATAPPAEAKAPAPTASEAPKATIALAPAAPAPAPTMAEPLHVDQAGRPIGAAREMLPGVVKVDSMGRPIRDE